MCKYFIIYVVFLQITDVRYVFAEERSRTPKLTSDFVDTSKDVNTKHNNPKGYFANLILDKLSHNAFLKPIQDKLEHVSSILATDVQPSNAYGDFQKFDPQNIIDKIHQKSSQLLTGAKASIYGLRPNTNYDYPFAYRRSLDK
ncbi:uncharacterized protein LOC143193250 [Rhynchophorus ferrugineus]|uniref:uncharacterized protein LOC143193250 n=1 Tax=Rhynchophorus ferrugineus TaxID=354439 RepID=UPI003FCC9E6F